MNRRRLLTTVRRARHTLYLHRETVRNVVLVVFAAGVLIQSAMLWSYALTGSRIPWYSLHTAPTAYTAHETDNSACALPVRFAARGEDGLYGIQYNAEGVKAAYEQTADVWAQAYENADEPVQGTAEQYRTALRGQMLVMEYNGSIPVHIAAGWLNSEVEQELANYALGAAALCRSADGYVLWIRDNESGSLVSAQTTVDDSLFHAAVSQFEPNDCTIAADEDSTAVSPDLLYFPGGETFDVMSFQAYTGGSGMEQLLNVFRLDAQAALEHAYGAEGVMVYVSGASTVRMAEDGSMRYDGKIRLPVTGGHDRLMQCVQTGYELTGAALEAIDCGASPSLIKAYPDVDAGRYIVVFGLQIGGVPVDNAVTGYFARYEFEGDAMVHANLALRTCQATGETIAVMPEKQAAASLTSIQNAVLSLRYIDPAVGTNSTWEQLYNNGTEDGLWDAELDGQSEADEWQDALDDTGDVSTDMPADDALGTPWYDTTGTPISPQWYVLQYGDTEVLPDYGQTISPDEIVAIPADFDRMIQGGAAS